MTSETGEKFECDIDLFDAERDPFPYPDGYFSTILCCELIEHLPNDPMHMMMEINRILKTGGHLVLTTPNIACARWREFCRGFIPCNSPPTPSASRANPARWKRGMLASIHRTRSKPCWLFPASK